MIQHIIRLQISLLRDCNCLFHFNVSDQFIHQLSKLSSLFYIKDSPACLIKFSCFYAQSQPLRDLMSSKAFKTNLSSVFPTSERMNFIILYQVSKPYQIVSWFLKFVVDATGNYRKHIKLCKIAKWQSQKG